MRTTIDLPDELFRRAKSEAALRGMKFKEYAAALFRQGIVAEEETPSTRGRDEPIPVTISPGRLRFPPDVTNADLCEALENEDIDGVREKARGHDRRPA